MTVSPGAPLTINRSLLKRANLLVGDAPKGRCFLVGGIDWRRDVRSGHRLDHDMRVAAAAMAVCHAAAVDDAREPEQGMTMRPLRALTTEVIRGAS